MKAALAIIFVACLTGSMAADIQSQFFNQLIQQGQSVVEDIMNQLQTNIMNSVINSVQEAAVNLEPINAFIESNPILNHIVEQIKPQIAGPINIALAQILSGLSGLIGGTYF